MPTPNKGESEKDYVSRCIPIVIADGTAKDGSQANAICHSMYTENKKNKFVNILNKNTMGYMGLPIFEFKIDKNKKEDGVKLISIVDKPATESNFYMFASDEEKHKYNFIDVPKGMIAGLALVPNKYIYRNTDGQEFYGFFSKDTIVDIRNKFMKEKHIDQVNFEHIEELKANDIYMVESYIVNTENQQKDLKKFGIEAPIGSWFVQYKCDNLEAFNKIKEVGFKGFSVEAYLENELVQLNNLNKNQNIMNKIIERFKTVLAEVEADLKKDETVDRIAETGQEVKVGKEGEPVTLAVTTPNGAMTDSPCPDGTFPLENGDTIEVKAGTLVTRTKAVPLEAGLTVGEVKPNDKTTPTKPAESGDTQAVSGSTQLADYPWNTCIQDQLDAGYDQASAEAICGKIKSENASAQDAIAMLEKEGFACKKKDELKVDLPLASGSTAPELPKVPEVDVSKKTLGDLVDVGKDGTYDIAVVVQGGAITEASVKAEQNLIEKLNAEIVTLKAQLKLPITQPIVNQKDKKTFTKEELEKMTPYERNAAIRGMRIIK